MAETEKAVIQIDAYKLKKALVIVVWGAAIALIVYGGFKFAPSFGAGQYALLDTGELMTEFQANLSKENFLAYKDQDIEAKTRQYYEAVMLAADRVAKQHRLIILDKGALIAAPNKIIDVTQAVKRELASQQ
jgi:hypothetical protein